MGATTPAPGRGGLARVVAASVLANLAVIGLVVVALRWPDPQPITLATAATARALGGREVTVCVSGAVRYPGIYRLPADATVADAVAAAGGPLAGAAADAIDAMLPLGEGTVVHVPGEQPSRALAPLDINQAGVVELEMLPGIGPVLAGRIVEYRESRGPFSTIEELMNVQGIGEKTLDGLRGLVTVR
ncbi:MAG: helix-hairpin-helix domain-containing protein [Anaerolineae bacterium]|nr:helix-hairpin-helix domain-containing protein [Anaerolineae bacterium]